MSFLAKFAITFIVLTLMTTALASLFEFDLKNGNYWDYHGFWFLFFLATFPRLTLLFSSVASGGLLWWLGWLFTPRFLVAILATISYWKENPILVILAWLICFGGESGEKTVITKRVRVVSPRQQRQSEAIDVDFERMK